MKKRKKERAVENKLASLWKCTGIYKSIRMLQCQVFLRLRNLPLNKNKKKKNWALTITTTCYQRLQPIRQLVWGNTGLSFPFDMSVHASNREASIASSFQFKINCCTNSRWKKKRIKLKWSDKISHWAHASLQLLLEANWQNYNLKVVRLFPL